MPTSYHLVRTRYPLLSFSLPSLPPATQPPAWLRGSLAGISLWGALRFALLPTFTGAVQLESRVLSLRIIWNRMSNISYPQPPTWSRIVEHFHTVENYGTLLRCIGKLASSAARPLSYLHLRVSETKNKRQRGAPSYYN